MYVSKELKQFARFVREQELDSMIREYLQLVYTYNIPLLQHLAHLSETEIYEQAKEGIVTFLKGFEDETAMENVKESLRLWEADQLPNIPKFAITQLDIFLISTAQKVAFLKLLPRFAAHAETPTSILVELEDYYKDLQWLSLNALQNIQEEQKHQLKESEARYRDLFDNASDLIQIISPEGQIMYVNEAWKNTLGYSPEEANELTIYHIVAPNDVDAYRNCREQILNGTKETCTIALTFVSKNGAHVSVEDSISAKFRNGRPLYSQCIMRDVTLRNKTEAQIAEYVKRLEESEENLRLLFENAPDAVVVANAKTQIVYWNAMAEKMFGWKADEVIGKPFADVLIPERHQTQYADAIQRFIETGEWDYEGVTIEMVLQNKLTREFYAALTTSQSSTQGNPTYISFIRDIDEIKKVELRLEEQRRSLEDANRELEQYAWLASHDLKEPLRKILTFSDMMLTRYNQNMDDRVKESLMKISSSAYRMHDMIEAVFNYSHLASGVKLVRVVDLNQTLAEVLADLEMVLQEKNATINIYGLHEIEGDPAQLRQLFQNLISNSLKYSREDISPIIEIKGAIANNKLEITLEDNGIGFDEQFADKMFQIFKRLVTKTEYKGTGIGLAICRKIANNHGGTIIASSPQGKGALFHITLPLYQPRQ